MRKKTIILAILLVTINMTAQEILPKIIRVTGEGIVKVVPDQATIVVRVENRGNDVIAVKSENDAAIAKVFAYTKKVGIAEKDVQTEYINLNKDYNYNKKTYSFTANQTIRVKIRKLSDYDKIMSGLLGSGINRINSVNFGVSNSGVLKKEARKKAVLNAKEKAEEYAEVLGQKIGKAIQIQEQETGHVPTNNMHMRMSASLKESDVDGPTIAPGELIIKSKIHITFDLD